MDVRGPRARDSGPGHNLPDGEDKKDRTPNDQSEIMYEHDWDVNWAEVAVHEAGEVRWQLIYCTA